MQCHPRRLMQRTDEQRIALDRGRHLLVIRLELLRLRALTSLRVVSIVERNAGSCGHLKTDDAVVAAALSLFSSEPCQKFDEHLPAKRRALRLTEPLSVRRHTPSHPAPAAAYPAADALLVFGRPGCDDVGMLRRVIPLRKVCECDLACSRPGAAVSLLCTRKEGGLCGRAAHPSRRGPCS